MRPLDAIFMALVASRCLDRPQRWWLVLLVPMLALGIGCCDPLGRFDLPITALIVVLLIPKWAPVGLFLAMPGYSTIVQCLGVTATWLGLDVVVGVILARLRDDVIPARLRGWPIRLLIIAFLYYTLLPLAWL